VTFPLVPHHAQRARRGLVEAEGAYDHEGDRISHRRLSDNGPEQMGSLYQGYGTHYVDLWCGSPPQRQTVIVDTGSSQTAFPCGDCRDCGSPDYHVGKVFEEAISESFESFDCDGCSQRSTCNTDNDRCEIEQYYSEGSSWTAYEARDTCFIGGFHNTALLEDNGGTEDINPGHAPAFGFPLRFGCQTKVTGLFKTQLADGILGMCDGKQAFWHQMYRAHKIKQKQFSLCYTRPDHASREGTEAGAITLGGSDSRLHKNPMVYSTIVGTSTDSGKKSGYYDVYVREMYLRDGSGGTGVTSTDENAVVVKLHNSREMNEEGGVIVDSGTTDTYLSKLIKKTFRIGYKRLAGIQYHHDKLTLNEDELAAMPTLLLQLAGDEELNQAVADEYGRGDPNNVPGLTGDFDSDHPLDVLIAVPASHYMEVLKDGRYMNRIYDTEEEGSVLGANVMMGHDVLFDASHKRIGWAESSCDYNGLVTSHGYESALGDVSVETEEEVEEEEEEEEEQEDLKETFDEENTEEEITIEEENIEGVEDENSFLAEDDSLEDDEYEEENGLFTTKISKKPRPATSEDSSYNFDIPMEDIKQKVVDNPGIVGGGVLLMLVLSCCCGLFTFWCCCSSKRKKKRSRRMRQQRRELEMKGKASYKDDLSDHSDSESDTDEEAEYGQSKNV